MRRVRWAVGLALFMDAALFLAVVPLLPYYAERFSLSTVEAGLVVAAYPVMVLASSIPAGALTGRLGGRRLTIAGSAVITVATLVFAAAPNGAVLAGARALQGLSSGITWTAGMAWLTGTAPADRRGGAAGGAMAMVSAGALAGPGLGALAGATSPGAAFALAGCVGAVTTLVALLSPSGPDAPTEGPILATARRALRSPLVVAAMAIGTVDSVVAAVVGLLAPLELGRRGLDATAIGGALVLGAAVGTACGPVAGRLADRVGALRLGLWSAVGMSLVPAVLVLPLPTAGMLGVLVLVNPLFTFLATSMYPPAAEGAERLGLGHGAAYGLLSVAWGIGYAVGPVVGAVASEVGGDAVAYAISSAAGLALVGVALRATRQARLALSS